MSTVEDQKRLAERAATEVIARAVIFTGTDAYLDKGGAREEWDELTNEQWETVTERVWLLLREFDLSTVTATNYLSAIADAE